MSLRTTRNVFLSALTLAVLAGCSGPGGNAAGGGPDAPSRRSVGGSGGEPALGARGDSPREIPGLGARTGAELPADAAQAVVVTGEAADSATNTVVRYERGPDGVWQTVGEPWSGHNGLKGWSDHHVQGDLRSPVGVFGLTDAGGLLANPGTRLPYDEGGGFTAQGAGSQGEPLAGSFDYVIAVNYNRKPGTTPLDWTRPMGTERGGGIWIHVDHDGPTQGCVSLPKDRMAELLRWLDPARQPVVVMGDRESLGR
ncbi:L,D-transpeptidase family protein [Streptomyces sp. NPDC087917]|uniref:L,D-transpeptidase family protein n=1 Tax=Streptomyces sp. NPDC087917 TaxID=3155060 RepID=UPI003424D36D